VLKKPARRYPLSQSPLFRIKGKGQLSSLLHLDWDAIEALLSSESYRVWLNDKKREIQQPIGRLGAVHSRIGDLFSRIELPDYLYSQKGRSYADNAWRHRGEVPLIKTDIHKFYPSTTWMMVYRMFCIDFECADDVAHRLADLCCYQQKHLPTGSPLSGRIAFFAARHMFDAVSSAAEREGCKMTAYVDDLTLSGSKATKVLLGEVRRIVRQHGLKTTNKKSRTYAATSPKPVTGAVVCGNELRLPNERHRKIEEVRQALKVAAKTERPRLQRVLLGRVQESKQVLRERESEAPVEKTV
jgi:hypothetical protein